MSREHLRRASDELREAAGHAAGDERERLDGQADQLADLAGTGADHGRLARHENVLRELASATDGEASDRIDAALSAIRDYRETIEGV